MIVGFTGTSLGMRPAQKAAVFRLLELLAPIDRWNHGLCVGADEEATVFVVMRFVAPCANIVDMTEVVAHPGPDLNGPKVAKNLPAFEIRKPMGHFARNRNIKNKIQFDVAISRACR